MKPIEKQVILVTGATDGIGQITAFRLAQQGATVLVHGRSPEKCAAAMKEIRDQTENGKLAAYAGDLSSLSAVRKLAGDILADYPSLDVLINNAGVLPGADSGDNRLLSEDGFELCLAINFLAPFLLTHLLLPALQKETPSRIVNVSSVAQKSLDFDDIMLGKGYTSYLAYARSKLALTMFTFDLAEKLKNTGITVNCLHPGTLLDTKMVRQSNWSPQGSAESGADVEMYVATAPELESKTGQYFNEKNIARAHDQAYDGEARNRLWRLGEELVGLTQEG